jgi:SpoVK/Ycf46/Vps4 family AAA+-type ATPase
MIPAIEFEAGRIYRPRLLIHGHPGLGQHYLAAAALHFMERVHVQSFDLGTLLSDATRVYSPAPFCGGDLCANHI